ncbi:MAG: DUF4129 domain-containing protein [Desulfobacterales bacterium]|jgi:hypothetical protein|nr:DUF4129 domain-containing protein [Desulfobacterales bacterium]
MNQALPRGMGALFAGGMEACWMAGGLWLLEARASPDALPVLRLLLGLPLAFVLWRFTRTLSPPLRLSAGIAGGVVWTLLLTAFSTFPLDPLPEPAWVAGPIGRLFQRQGAPNPTQLTALAAVGTWVAGLRLAAVRVGFDRLLSEFQFGLPILLLIFFCAVQWDATLPAPAALAFAFFAFFLLGMAAARGADAGGWLQGPARARWLIALVCNAALVLAVGLLLTAAVTPEALKIVLDALQALWDAMVDWVVRFIAFLARLIPQPEIKPYPAGGGAGSAPRDPSAVADLLQIPDYVRRIAAFIVAAFWVVLFGVCLWRMASQVAAWLRRQMNDPDGAEVETLRGAWRQDLRRLLRRVLRRMRGWFAWLGYALGRRGAADPLPEEAAAVRRLYRRLLAWSAAGGCPRRRHQTPHEFLGRLCERLPEARAKLALITDHYTEVRYGGRRPGGDIVKLLESTWQDVRHIGAKNGSKTWRKS